MNRHRLDPCAQLQSFTAALYELGVYDYDGMEREKINVAVQSWNLIAKL